MANGNNQELQDLKVIGSGMRHMNAIIVFLRQLVKI